MTKVKVYVLDVETNKETVYNGSEAVMSAYGVSYRTIQRYSKLEEAYKGHVFRLIRTVIPPKEPKHKSAKTRPQYRVTSLVTNQSKDYDSLKELSYDLNISCPTVRKYLESGDSFHGYVFDEIEEE